MRRFALGSVFERRTLRPLRPHPPPLAMQNEIRWLVRLCIDRNLITMDQADSVRIRLGDGADMVDFAQQLIDDGHIEDHSVLEDLAGIAFAQAKAGPPADDPFADVPPLPSQMASRAAARGTTAPPFMAAGGTGPASLPSMAFDTLDSMDDGAVQNALRTLLRDCARYGASDLHLSAGTRPFIRFQRAIKPISPTSSTNIPPVVSTPRSSPRTSASSSRSIATTTTPCSSPPATATASA